MVVRCFHVITGLNDGGAEAALYRLCKHDQSNQHEVVSLSGDGKYGPMLRELGVPVTTLNISSGWQLALALLNLVKLLRRAKPDVVQTWMYHSDLLGGLAARVAGNRAVVWGVRQTTFESGNSKQTTIWIRKLLAKLSWWLPAEIVVCAQRAMDVHRDIGYDLRKMRFIPNGYSLVDFHPALSGRKKFRTGINAIQSIPLIGMVGRFDAQKDHVNLLDALRILRDRGVQFHCILVGTGMDRYNQQIVEWISQRGLTDRVQLLGQRNDIPEIMNALDLHVLSSAYGEAFPNVVGEAMACGTPCVVTDVGDAAFIVGDTGWVVPPRDAHALAEALVSALYALDDPVRYKNRSRLARRRIEEHFSIERMVDAYSECWSSVVERTKDNS